MKKLLYVILALVLIVQISLLSTKIVFADSVPLTIGNSDAYIGVDPTTGKDVIVFLFDMTIQNNGYSDLMFYKNGVQAIDKDSGIVGVTNIQTISSNMIDKGDYYSIPESSDGVISFMTLWDPSDLPNGLHNILFSLYSTYSINGVCSNSNNICTAGTSVDSADTTLNYNWNCNGISGGTNALCSIKKICGATNNSCTATSSNILADSYTNNSIKLLVDGAPFSDSTIYGTGKWRSFSLSGAPSLTSNINPVVDVVMFGDSGGNYNNNTVINRDYYMSPGAAWFSGDSTYPIPNAMDYESIGKHLVRYLFLLQSGDMVASPAFNINVAAVGGICGNTQFTCTAGTLNPNTKGDRGTYVTWTCLADGRGTDASCSMPKPQNGACGTTNNTCKIGTVINIASSSSAFLWSCHGSNGGSDTACTLPKPVSADGICSSVTYACDAGSLVVSNTVSNTDYLWSCNGLNGGKNISCNSPKPVNGICGTSQNTCNSGSVLAVNKPWWSKLLASVVSVFLASNDGSWKCVGSNGGTTATCTVPKVPVNGTCGKTSNLCISGVLNDVADSATSEYWNCNGTAGGTDASCNLPIVVNGSCGKDVNSCVSGSLNDVPDSTTMSLWNCNGANGGSNSSCSIPKIINGVCGAVNNSCLSGSSSDIPDSNMSYLWNCNGASGGATTLCSLAMPKDGSCGLVNNTCKTGSLDDVTDSSTNYLWNCNGVNGGTNISCHAELPPSGVCGSTPNSCVNGAVTQTITSSSNYNWMCDNFDGRRAASCSMLIPIKVSTSSTAQAIPVTTKLVVSPSSTSTLVSVPKVVVVVPTNNTPVPVTTKLVVSPSSTSTLVSVPKVVVVVPTSSTPVQTVKTNGVCDNTTVNTCKAGTLNDIADSAKNYLWTCKGANGGKDSVQCSMPIPLKVGACTGTASVSPSGATVTRIKWTMNDVSGPGTISYKWSGIPLPAVRTTTIPETDIDYINKYFIDGKTSVAGPSVEVTAGTQKQIATCSYTIGTSMNADRLNFVATALKAIQDLLKLLVK